MVSTTDYIQQFFFTGILEFNAKTLKLKRFSQTQKNYLKEILVPTPFYLDLGNSQDPRNRRCLQDCNLLQNLNIFSKTLVLCVLCVLGVLDVPRVLMIVLADSTQSYLYEPRGCPGQADGGDGVLLGQLSQHTSIRSESDCVDSFEKYI